MKKLEKLHLLKHNALRYIVLLVLGIAIYNIPIFFLERGSLALSIIRRVDMVFITLMVVMFCNSLLLSFLDIYTKTEKNKQHPIRSLVQVIQVLLFFIGGIVILSVVLNKSLTALYAGLGASAAVLMLIFKDSILGFVAGVQLSTNDMVKIGDWIQMPDGSADGNVEDITLNTVKVRNWDNTITMIPPYTLVSSPFKNWRGMEESEGRRADKCINIDVNGVADLSPEETETIVRSIPLLDSFFNNSSFENDSTNLQLYRTYIELYLKQNQFVNQNLTILVTQKEVGIYGIPIRVYFFTSNKDWVVHEKQQSDIFNHLIAIAPKFNLRVYQRPA